MQSIKYSPILYQEKKCFKDKIKCESEKDRSTMHDTLLCKMDLIWDYLGAGRDTRYFFVLRLYRDFVKIIKNTEKIMITLVVK